MVIAVVALVSGPGAVFVCGLILVLLFISSTTHFTSIPSTCFKSIITSFTLSQPRNATSQEQGHQGQGYQACQSHTLQSRVRMMPSPHEPLLRTLNLHREYKPMASLDTP